MIFIYKTHLPSRVKCLIKMGGTMITPRKLKYKPPFISNPIKPKKSSIYSYIKTPLLIDSAKICALLYFIYIQLSTI